MRWNRRRTERLFNDSRRVARWRLWLIDAHCAYCGIYLRFCHATIDHVMPRSAGGSNDPSNLVLACNACNQAKDDLHPSEVVCLLPVGAGCVPVYQLAEWKGSHMSKVTGFNYAALKDDALTNRLTTQAREIRGLLSRTGAIVVEIGMRLLEVRETLNARQFNAWVHAEFQWSQSMAVIYQQAARRFGTAKSLENFQPYAIYQLSRNTVPDEVVTEAVRLAASGTIVTGKRAKELLRKHNVQSTRCDAGKRRKPTALDELNQALESIAGKLADVAGAWSRSDREALADRFLKLALELRSIENPSAVPAISTQPVKSGSRSSRKKARTVA